ncbi:hypothetical protein BH09VER1_BH09VER1_25980 [soil metagenome]
MKRSLLVLLCFPACTVARSEDVRLTSGKVLRDVEILWADQSKITIKENRVGASGVGYPWSMINPEDAKGLYARMLEKQKDDQLAEKMEETAQVLRIEIIQITPDGVLARAATVFELGYNAIRSTPKEVKKGTTYYTDEDIEQPIWIYLKDTSKLVDGMKDVLKLYPAGIYRYDAVTGANKTVKAFCPNMKVAAVAAEATVGKQ